MTGSGRCLCSAVTFRYTGEEHWCAHCHCESCRRQTSSPVTTFVSVARDGFAWLSAEPTVFESSPGVRRLFCPVCGSPVAYDNDAYPNEIHLFRMTIDPRSDLSEPSLHDFWHERVPWLHVEDDLPKE